MSATYPRHLRGSVDPRFGAQSWPETKVVKLALLLIGGARKRPDQAPEWANPSRSASFETGQFAGQKLQGFLC